MRKKAIYTMAMAKFLTDRGFESVGTAPNKNDLKKMVWFFERTPELDAVCAKYIEASKQRKEAGRPKIPTLSGRTLANMHLEQGLTIEDVAKITGYSKDRIKTAVKNQKRLRLLFAFAAMTYTERQAYMDAQSDSEREQLVNDRLKRGRFFVYGGQDSYDFRASAEAGEVGGNA